MSLSHALRDFDIAILRCPENGDVAIVRVIYVTIGGYIFEILSECFKF